jgi:mono/diheme cytochrome c family protein
MEHKLASMPRIARSLLFCAGNLLSFAAAAATTAEPSRGDMLYHTHCIACHTEHVHWRDARLAHDWGSLVKQVGRWQRNTGLQWSDEDIAAVARYLNARYYHFPAGPGQKEYSDKSR